MTAEIHSPHDLRIWELLEARRYDEAQAQFDRVNIPLREMYARLAQKSGGQARLKKGMMALMGIPMGASRPPSLPLNSAEMAELNDLLVGFGWPVKT